MSSHLSKLASLSEARSVATAEGARSLREKSAQSQRMAALRAAWLAHTIKRAIAAASSASDEDYRVFGWDREELLAQLRWLRGDLGRKRASHRLPQTVAILRPARSARWVGEALKLEHAVFFGGTKYGVHGG